VQRQVFDSGYVQRLGRSDPATERHFATYFGEILTLKLRPRLRSPDLIGEVVQETFARVLSALRRDEIDNPHALGSFVDTTCNYVLFDVYRRQSRVADPPSDNRASEEPAPDMLVATQQERDLVRRILATMPEKERTILRWVFLEERDRQEVCRTLGVDPEYLRVLIHRAKDRFRKYWRRQDETKSPVEPPIG
jgi:RNA polymerase sigma-70 factor (ECF subfamily)